MKKGSAGKGTGQNQQAQYSNAFGPDKLLVS